MPERTNDKTQSIETQHTTERLLSLTQASRRFPGRGETTVTPSTLRRWIARGVVDADGRRVRLRGARLGSKWLTSDRWISEFIEALASSETEPIPASEPLPSDPKWLKAAERAGRRLAAIGA